MSTTEIILTEKIANLGAEADVVKVKRGYARNFLVPRGLALEVTPATLKRLNLLKAKRAEREVREVNEAEELARRINKLKLNLELETGETGKAFGSITAADLAERIKKGAGRPYRNRPPQDSPRQGNQGFRQARRGDQTAPRRDGQAHRDRQSQGR